VLSLLVMGDHVNVRVDDAARRAPELQARLSARQVAIGDIARVEPGIEDVFVALVGADAAA
jgi:ABC-2 type transport system ATP-binding protein